MTQIFEEVPHTSSHCHTHTEAVLYVLEGVGFSEIDEEHYDWEAGEQPSRPGQDVEARRGVGRDIANRRVQAGVDLPG